MYELLLNLSGGYEGVTCLLYFCVVLEIFPRKSFKSTFFSFKALILNLASALWAAYSHIPPSTMEGGFPASMLGGGAGGRTGGSVTSVAEIMTPSAPGATSGT